MQKTIKRITAIGLLLISVLFAGCSEGKVTYPEGTETYIYTDDYGREVEVKKNIETIVGSGPNTQIILCTIASSSTSR